MSISTLRSAPERTLEHVSLNDASRSGKEEESEDVLLTEGESKHVKFKRLDEYSFAVQSIAILFSLIPFVNTLIFGSLAIMYNINFKQEQQGGSFTLEQKMEMNGMIFLAIPIIGNSAIVCGIISGCFTLIAEYFSKSDS